MSTMIVSTKLTNLSVKFEADNPNKSVIADVGHVIYFERVSKFCPHYVGVGAKGKLRIKSARLTVLGAEGIGAGDNIAAEILLAFKSTGSDAKDVAYVHLIMSSYGVWENKDIEIEYGGIESDWEGASDTKKANRLCQFACDAGSSLSVNSFNVQDSFVDQTRTPKLELEIETDSILDASTGLAI